MSLVEAGPVERPRSPWLVLFSPGGAFAAVRERPRPWLTLLVVCALAVVPGLVFVSVVDMQDFLLAQLDQRGAREQLSESSLHAIRERVAPAMTFGLPLLAALKRALTLLVVASLGFLLLRGINKALSFRACLAAVALAVAPLILQDAIRALLFAVRDIGTLDVRNPVLSNPAAWLGLSPKENPLGALLRGLDLFELWTAWLGAVGLNLVAGTRSALPYAVTFGGQALVTLAAVIGALVGSSA